MARDARKRTSSNFPQLPPAPDDYPTFPDTSTWPVVCVCRHLPLLVVVALASFKAPRQQWPTRVTFTAQWDKGLHTNAFRVECVRVNRVGGHRGPIVPRLVDFTIHRMRDSAFPPATD